MPKISQFTAQTGASVANGDLFPIVDVGSPNVSEYITADELAQMPQLTSRYAPLAAVDSVFIGAGAMGPVAGSPSLQSASGSGLVNDLAWRFDKALEEIVGANVLLPSYWSTFKIEIYLVNVASSVGNVSVRCVAKFAGSGDVAVVGSGAVVDSSSTLTPSATANTISVHQMGGTLTNTANKPLFLSVWRRGDAVADTLDNDLGLFGIMFTKVA